ncbi:hypothetical protein STEG23_005393 [Scotinomys teguina]
MKSSGKRDTGQEPFICKEMKSSVNQPYRQNLNHGSIKQKGERVMLKKTWSLKLSCQTLRFHLTPVQMALNGKTRHVVENVDQGTLTPFLQECELVEAHGSQCGHFFKKLKTDLPVTWMEDGTTEMRYISVCYNTIHSS